MRILKTSVVALLHFLGTVTFSQESRSIKVILDSLVQTRGLSFSYLDQNLENVKVPSGDNITLDSLIRFVENYTLLEIHEVSADNYVVVKPSKKKIIYSGSLLDAETKEPLIGALVYGHNFAISDANGEFKLDAFASEVLNVQHVGYGNIQIPSFIEKGYQSQKFYLDYDPTILPEITIYNYLTRGISKTQDGAFLISRQSMRMLPGLIEPDVLHSLQFLPGISSINETVSEVNIRGGTNDQNLILYDGIRIYQSGHFFGLISVFNPQVVKESRLIKQGTSPQYGDGVSGTIVLNSSDQVPQHAKFNFGINMLFLDGLMNIPMGKNGVILAGGRKSFGEFVHTPTYNSYFERAFKETEVRNSSPDAAALANSNENLSFYDYNLKFINKFSNRDELKINFFSVFNEVQFLENAVINNIRQSRKSSLDQESLAGGIEYEKWWSGNLVSNFVASVSNYKLKAINSNILQDQELTQLNEVLDYQFKVVSRVLLEKSDLMFGYQGNNLGVTNANIINRPSLIERVKKVADIHSIFVEGNRKFGMANFRVGFRSNYYDGLKKVTIEPRGSISRTFGQYFGVELTGEVKSQTLFQKIDLQTDFLGIEKRKWILAERRSSDLIRGNQVSMGLSYKRNRLLINIEGYVKKANNISIANQGFLNQFQDSTGIGRYIVKGMDVVMSHSVGPIGYWASYTFMQNKYEFNMLTPATFANNIDIPHTVTLGINFSTPQLELSTGINWHSGRPTTGLDIESATTGVISYNLPNSERLIPYFRTDISGMYSWNFSSKFKIDAGLSIWNLTNRKNIVNAYFERNLDEISKVEKTALPLTINMLIRTHF